MTDREKVLKWLSENARERLVGYLEVAEALRMDAKTASFQLSLNWKLFPELVFRRRERKARGVSYSYKYVSKVGSRPAAAPLEKGRSGPEAAKALGLAMAGWLISQCEKPSRIAQVEIKDSALRQNGGDAPGAALGSPG